MSDDAISNLNAWVKGKWPERHKKMEEAYDWAADKVKPATSRVKDTWNKYSPAIPTQEDVQHCFQLGWKFEKKHFAYPPVKVEPPKPDSGAAPSSAEPAPPVPLLSAADKAKEGWNALRIAFKTGGGQDSKQVEEDARALMQKMYEKLNPEELPLNGVIQAIKGQATIVESELPQGVKNKTVSAKWLFAAVHTGREAYRRREHLNENLGYALRWAVLWYAMGAMHPWARNAGFLGGVTFATFSTIDLFEKPETNAFYKGKFDIANGAIGGVRKVVNRNTAMLHWIAVGSVGLALWHKLRLPELSPLATSAASLTLGATAGHYVASPVAGSVHKDEKPKQAEKTDE